MVEMETWKNVGKGKAEIIKLDPRGIERGELIDGGKTFTITREERLINQDRCLASKNDSFSNGRFSPVRILDGDEPEHDMALSPNLISEGDLQGLFKQHWKTFEKKIAEISSVITLQRLLDIANEKDATVKQVKVIEERLFEIDSTAFPQPGIDLAQVKTKPGINPINLDDM